MKTGEKRGRGRPRVEGSAAAAAKKRKATMTSVSVPVELRDALNDYREALSDKLGIDLTIAQSLKYLIKNAEVLHER